MTDHQSPRARLMTRWIGTGIGAIPGTGGPIAAFLAYDHARRFSRHPERFGSGELSGVAIKGVDP